MVNTKKITTYAWAVPLAVATLFGTFYSRDTKHLKEQNKNELSSILYNRRGSSEGILIGFGNDVYGNATGLAVGVVNDVGILPDKNNQMRKRNLPVRLTGVNAGIVNFASSVNYGLQFGIVNSLERENGPYLQLGIVNVSPERWTLLVNFGFGKKNEDLETKVEK